MKKLYPKFLFFTLLILLSFSFVQKVLAEEIGGNIDFGLGYAVAFTGPPLNLKSALSNVVGVLILLPLALFSATTVVTFLYLKLRKRDTAKIKSLLRLGGLSLLTIAFLGLTLPQLKDLDYYGQSLVLIEAMLNDKIFLISATLSILSLLTFIYYLLRTIILFIAKKIKQRKKKIRP